MNGAQLAIRWTLGDVSTRGFDALELSIRSALTLFGEKTTFAVSVNTVPIADVRRRLASVADQVHWFQADAETPHWLQEHLDPAYAEGVAWKFAPVRLFPDLHELALDNDIIFWDVPASIRQWLSADELLLTSEDVRPAFGVFADLCPPQGRNSGIRGLAPGFDLEGELRKLLKERPVRLTSELDEQGLQIAVLTSRAHVVTTLDEVSICSPTPPHLPHLGRCGAHFVGLNAKKLPWDWNGKSGEVHFQEHWNRHLAEVTRRVENLQTYMY